MPTRIAYLFLATALLAGCRTGRNYPVTGRQNAGLIQIAILGGQEARRSLTTSSQDKQQ